MVIFMIYVQTRISNLKIEIHQEYSTIRAKGIFEPTKSELSPHSAKTFKSRTINLRKIVLLHLRKDDGNVSCCLAASALWEKNNFFNEK